MRILNSHELMSISGGDTGKTYFSNAFIAGMNGTGVPYSWSSNISSACAGGFIGLLVGCGIASGFPPAALVTGPIGIGVGAVWGWFYANSDLEAEYQAGANYVTAMKIVNG